ncbi:MAG: carboxypeptidase-like regulatory domain-containing protein, partial [Bacteroidota bacterium]
MRKLFLLLMGVVFFASQALAQRTVTGKVIDDKGSPVSNVSVLVKGTTTGTITGTDGNYSLRLPANAKQLVFSSVGFASQTVNITTASSYSITLLPEAKENEEVIVTGFSRVAKPQFSGASNKISAKDLGDRPVGSLDQLLQGRAPGILALTGSGQPGNNSTIIIRGVSSIVGGSTPLYILDGIPVEAGVF